MTKFRADTRPLEDGEIRELIRQTRDESMTPEARLEARNKILMANSGWRYCLAVRFLQSNKSDVARTFTVEDMANEGMIGEIRAIELFDFREDTRFVTYASFWIKQRMARAVEYTGCMIRRSVHTQHADTRIARLVAKTGRSEQEIVDDLVRAGKLKKGAFALVANSRFKVHLLGQPDPDSNDIPPDVASVVDPDDVLRRERIGMVRDAIEELDERQKEILHRRMHGETLGSIGEDFGFTKERARQVDLSARKHIRQHMQAYEEMTA